MKALVTGSAGFLGRHIVRALKASGEYLLVDERDITRSVHEDVRSLARRGSTDHLHYDLVVHCAATVGGREGIDFNAALLGANNLQLDGAMFEWALRARPGRFVYFSSAAAYSTHLQTYPTSSGLAEWQLDDPFDDYADGPAPDESYGWAKLTGEVMAREVRKAGVPVTVVRPFSCYEADQDDCYPFPEFVKRAKRHDNPFVVWGCGKQVRDWIHVDDLVAAVLMLVREGVDGPVNLGTGVGTSMDDLARLCMSAAGYEAPIKHLTDKPEGVRYRVADITELRRYYEPRIGIEEGVWRAVHV